MLRKIGKKPYLVLSVAVLGALAFVAMVSLMSQSKGISIEEAGIIRVESREDLDLFHISFLVKNAGKDDRSVRLSAEIGIKALVSYGDMGEKQTSFQSLGAKEFVLTLNGSEQKRVLDSIAVDKREYVKAVGGHSLPILRVHIE